MATRILSCAWAIALMSSSNIFLHYDECVSNDFSLSNGGKDLQLFQQRHPGLEYHLRRNGNTFEYRPAPQGRERYLAGEELFLANYADGLTDMPLPKLIEFSRHHDRIATFVSAAESHVSRDFRRHRRLRKRGQIPYAIPSFASTVDILSSSEKSSSTSVTVRTRP